MAGHSKWANIKHRKAAQDAKKGKVFSKLIREITVAAKMGGGDVDDNPRLRAAVDKALGSNMTRDTIDRAVQRGAGDNEADNVEELVYEGYGTGGIAVLVEVMTDNKNRTVAEVRHAFSKFGGNLGTSGSVAYLFSKIGSITFPVTADEDALLEAALDAGADDVSSDSHGIEVLTMPERLSQIKDTLDAKGLESETCEITMTASTEVTLDLSGAEKVLRLVDALEDLDDVQNVYTNADIPDEVLEQLSI